MRFPSFIPMNLRPKQETKFLPTEEDILLAEQQVREAQAKYDQTKAVAEKIDLEEAQMRLGFLKEELQGTGVASPDTGIQKEVRELPNNELEEVRKKIVSAERGIDLANQLNDMERLAQMMAKLQELRSEEQAIEHRLNEAAANTSAFDQAMNADREVAKQEKKIA